VAEPAPSPSSASRVVDPRLLQANERTLLAWIRTGLALMAFGFVIARLALWLRLEVHQDDPTSLWLGAAIVALGAGCQVIGAIRFVAARRAIVAGRQISAAGRGPVSVALIVGGIGAAMVVYILWS
jgi:putative membrane protein